MLSRVRIYKVRLQNTLGEQMWGNMTWSCVENTCLGWERSAGGSATNELIDVIILFISFVDHAPRESNDATSRVASAISFSITTPHSFLSAF